MNVEKTIRLIEQRVQRDEAQRGIAHLIQGSVLHSAAGALSECQTIGILTGFPCLVDFEPPIESDGIAGAFALARTFNVLGKTTTILTDPCSLPQLQALSEWQAKEFGVNTPVSDSDSEHFDGVIAIERSGRAKDGNYYTMRGISMTHLVKPLDVAYFTEGVVSVGIGDGGNEAGTGNVQSLVEQFIPNGELIACTIPSKYPFLCSISTWGAYALSLAISLVTQTAPALSEGSELAMAQQLMQLGIRDGVTKEIGLTIDGVPFSETESLLRDFFEYAKQVES